MRFFMMLALLLLPLNSSASVGQPEVLIGVNLSLTGEFSAAGRKALAGIRMRADDHNAHDAKAVNEGLYKIRNFPLATGSISIDPQRGSEKSAYVHRIDDKGGEFIQSVIDVVTP